MKTNSKLLSRCASLGLLFSLLLSACGPGAATSVEATPSLDPQTVSTQVAATILAGITETAAALPSATPLPPSATLEPSLTPSPSLEATALALTLTPAPAAPAVAASPTVDASTAFDCYNATFLLHVTQPYAPAFQPGARFTKTWRVKNTGSCDWPKTFKLAFISGDRFGAENIEIGQKVLTGATADLSLPMVAPSLNGVVTSNWQLTTELNKPFGQVLSASITLPGKSTGATSSDCLNAQLISEAPAASGTQFDLAKPFTKTWVIKNAGTCVWNSDFKFTFVGGATLGSDTRKIRKEVSPGGSLEISLEMTSPNTAGSYTSSWQMASDTGNMFGQVFSFEIVVK